MSGAISAINDPDLRSVLLRWDNLHARIESLDQSVEGFRSTTVIPVVIKSMVLGNGFATDDRFTGYKHTDRFGFDVEAIRSDITFDNAVSLRQANAEQQLTFVEDFSEATEELISALEEAAR
ncbi:MAG: hypothetical protein HRU11_12820 [Parvularculaceae bacterium]|nr:hypothetical protein [Parvularculaceae bacterium]